MRASLIRSFSFVAISMALQLSAGAQAYVQHRAEAAGGGVPVMPAEPVQGVGAERPAMMVDPDHKLQQGDILSFSIEEDREPATPLQVSAAGEVRIEPLCSVKVAGMTVDEASRTIKRRLDTDFYYSATVRLALEQVNQKLSLGFVYLSGEIMKVGSVPVFADRPMKLSEAILNSSGFGQFANMRKVKITRRNKSGGPPEVFIKDVKAILQEGQTDKDMQLQDGDQIFVPRVGIKF
jgi:protein involved in polysaccharide export with SLBB domain